MTDENIIRGRSFLVIGVMDLRGQSLRLRQQALEAAPLLLEAAWIWLRA